MELNKKIQELISEGETEKAIKALVEYAKDKNSHISQQAFLLSGQFKQWKRENSLGINKSSNELRRIELSIMELLEGYQSSANQAPTKLSTPPPPPVSTKEKSTNWMPVVIGILGVAVVALAFLYFSGDKSHKHNGTAVSSAGITATTGDTKPAKEEKETTASTGTTIPKEKESTEDSNPPKDKLSPPPTDVPEITPPPPSNIPAISKYKTIKLAGKTWMSQNLNEAADGSICYNEDSFNCTTFGRLYTFEAARKACADLGRAWRLPNNADWKTLTRAYGGALLDLEYDGKESFKQLSKGGSSNFNAELGGKRIYFSENQQFFFYDVNDIGYYWSDEDKNGSPDQARMYTFRGRDNTLLYEAIPKNDFISCRCVKD